MSLNNISLPSQLLADLYQKVLIQDSAMPVPVPEPIPFLGKNKKNILILVDKKDVPFLPDHELSFLTNVLLACQLGLMDVAIVNWNNVSEKNVQLILEQLNSKELLLFDMDAKTIGLPKIEPFTVGIVDGHRFMMAPSLSTIEKTKEAKKQLWLALKELFCI